MLHTLWTSSWEPQGVQNILGRWLAFSLPSPWLYSLFYFFPFWNVAHSRSSWTGTDSTSEDTSLKISLQSPGEVRSLGRSQAQISEKQHPHAWASFSLLMKLVKSPSYTLLSRQMDTERNKDTDSCLFWCKPFHFSKMLLSESRHHWHLRDDSHLICLLYARLFNAS